MSAVAIGRPSGRLPVWLAGLATVGLVVGLSPVVSQVSAVSNLRDGTAAAGAGASADTVTVPPSASGISTDGLLTAFGSRFETNAGQYPVEVDFAFRGGGYTAFLDGGVATFELSGDGGSTAVTMRPVGANTSPSSAGADRRAGVVNYLYGDDSDGWVTGVVSYGQVVYRDVWPGIDLVYRGTGAGRLQYDFVVAPGADTDRIVLSFDGVEGLSVDGDGSLRLDTAAGPLVQQPPYAYQEVDGDRREVSSSFTVAGDRVGFDVGSFDRSKRLTIDPEVVFSTYLGGSQGFNAVTGEQTSASRDVANAVAVGDDGTVYVAGTTETGDFPTVNATQPQKGGGSDAFVAAFTADGQQLVYATFLGGDGEENAAGIATGEDGSVWVVGRTFADFPVTDDAYDPGCEDLDVQCQATRSAGGQNVFVARLTAVGAMDYSTYLAGGDHDEAHSVAVDAAGRAVVVGETSSADDESTPMVDEAFPTTDGAMQSQLADPDFEFQTDAFVAVVDASRSGEASLVYSSYFGGAVQDRGLGVAVDGADPANVYVTGATQSSDLGASSTVHGDLSGTRDAFVAALTWSGSDMGLRWTRYLGGHGFDEGLTVAMADGCTSSCDPWIGGWTRSYEHPDEPGSEAFPTTAGAVQRNLAGGADGFLTRMAPDGKELVWSTYLGGAQTDRVHGVAVATDGRLWATGESRSDDFHVLDPMASRSSLRDAFVTEVAPAGQLLSSSYLGGADDDVGNGAAPTPEGGAVVVGRTESVDFPTIDPFQADHARGEDAFVTRMAPQPPGAPLVAGLDPPGGPPSGGTTVEVVGRDFTQDAVVEFGGVRGEVVEVDGSGDRLVAVSPPHPEGRGAVTVTTPSGSSPANPISMFTYLPGFWRTVGQPATRRLHAAATLLDDGKILLTGGRIDNTIFDHADLYDPLDRTWTTSDNTMTEQRFGHTATLLDSGDVLIVGGRFTERSAELFDQDSGAFTAIEPPGRGHNRHTATLLSEPGCEPRCGHVLVAAGFGGGGGDTESRVLAAEVYDPQEQDWSFTGAMNGPTQFHTATVLAGPECQGPDAPGYCGDVLVVAGACTAYTSTDCAQYAPTLGSQTKRVEAYDPATNEWRSLQEAHANRLKHSAALLPDGRMTVVGGFLEADFGGGPLDSSETYDPDLDEWAEPGQLRQARSGHGMASLPDGRLFVAGGGPKLSELYEDGRWRAAQPTRVVHTDNHQDPRQIHAIVLSSDPFGFAADPEVCGFDCGKVLLIGGMSGDRQNPAEHAELYTPPPTVTDVEVVGGGPLEGPATGGTTLRLTGFGFSHHTRHVRFGDEVTVDCPLPDPAVANGTVPVWPDDGPCRIIDYHTLEVDVPAAASQSSAEVTVVNEGGGATAPEAFTYVGPPGRVDDLAASVLSESQVRLSWSAVGQVAHADPPAGDYIVKLSRQSIGSEADFDAATSLCGGVCTYTPGQVGDALDLKVEVRPGTDYHFAVKAIDDEGVAGAMSNVVQVTTPGSGDSGSGGTDQSDVAPGRVADLSAAGRSASEVELVWSAAGSDGDGGAPAGEYVVKQSFEPIDSEADFDAAFTLCGTTCRFGPSQVGEQISLSVTGLEAETRYFYAVKAVDAAGNVSVRSNTAAASTLAEDGVRRAFGAGRIQTAVELSREAFSGGASHAVVARADDFPDALAASVLAAEVDGPVLLSESGRLSDDTAAELSRLGADTVYLAGGTAALSEQVADDLRAMDVEVIRVAGADRVGTAAAIARRVAELGGRVDAAVVARADGFADALAAGPLAAYTRSPVLLTHTGDLPDDTLDVLGDVLADGGRITIAGGTAAVGQQPEGELEQAGYTVERLAGADRYATAVELADAAVTAGASRATVFAASGRNYPDALAAAPAAWRAGAVLVLVDPDDLDNSGATRDWLNRHADTIGQVLLAGGPAAVSDQVEDQLAGLVPDG